MPRCKAAKWNLVSRSQHWYNLLPYTSKRRAGRLPIFHSPDRCNSNRMTMSCSCGTTRRRKSRGSAIHRPAVAARRRPIGRHAAPARPDRPARAENQPGLARRRPAPVRRPEAPPPSRTARFENIFQRLRESRLRHQAVNEGRQPNQGCLLPPSISSIPRFVRSERAAASAASS